MDQTNVWRRADREIHEIWKFTRARTNYYRWLYVGIGNNSQNLLALNLSMWNNFYIPFLLHRVHKKLRYCLQHEFCF